MRDGVYENAVCPKCQTYTRQTVVKRGVRRCFCGHTFRLKDTFVIVSKGWIRCYCGAVQKIEVYNRSNHCVSCEGTY